MLGGCISETEHAAADRIITALPTEIEGCTFIRDVDAAGCATIESSRFLLRREAAKAGATHVVEVHAYPVQLIGNFFGVALTGRAYRCPAGKGPLLESDSARLEAPDYLPSPSPDDVDSEMIRFRPR